MKKELEEELVKLFPELYRQYDLSPQETCMCWGFECPDEWFYIISELSQRIHVYCQENGCKVEAAQVKEKFGGLRFYIDYIEGTDEDYKKIESFINEAEDNILKLNRILDVRGKNEQ